MKKSLVIFSFIVAFWACNSNDHKEEKADQPEKVHQHETKADDLSLNNGAKWNSDESTNKNVLELQAIADGFKTKTNPTVSDYKNLAGELQVGLDKMIKECRMQGKDHDALHLWLTPLLKNVTALNTVNSEPEGFKITSEVEEQLKKYQQYFE